MLPQVYVRRSPALVLRECIEGDVLPPARAGMFFGFHACQDRAVVLGGMQLPWEIALLGAYNAMYLDIVDKAHDDARDDDADREALEAARLDAWFYSMYRAARSGMTALRAVVEAQLRITRDNAYSVFCEFLRAHLDDIYAPWQVVCTTRGCTRVFTGADLDDDLSVIEFLQSGMCQTCQDRVFGGARYNIPRPP